MALLPVRPRTGGRAAVGRSAGRDRGRARPFRSAAGAAAVFGARVDSREARPRPTRPNAPLSLRSWTCPAGRARARPGSSPGTTPCSPRPPPRAGRRRPAHSGRAKPAWRSPAFCWVRTAARSVGVLNGLGRADPGLMADAEFRGLRGAAKVMIGRLKEAEADPRRTGPGRRSRQRALARAHRPTAGRSGQGASGVRRGRPGGAAVRSRAASAVRAGAGGSGAGRQRLARRGSRARCGGR
jgi:hypothetical protein